MIDQAKQASEGLAGTRAVVFDAKTGSWLALAQPLAVHATRDPALVLAVLRAVEASVEACQGVAAGWVSFEAAAGLDADLPVRAAQDDSERAPPLAWFTVFAKSEPIVLPEVHDEVIASAWDDTLTATQHGAALARIHDLIRAGDTYQVNFTYRLRALFSGDAWRKFLRLIAAQQHTYGAYIESPEWIVCSASPELYLRRDGTRITSKPMKGTAARGLTPEADARRAEALRASDKERAENLMIVDMVRNDFGRIAHAGSVRVPALFELERYPTIWQMTSTVEAECNAPLAAIFAATFPPASITGAPKRRTLEIIQELEATPRGVYTGAVGFVAPGQVAQFNVAIRTLVIDRVAGCAEYGVGSGVVWDSEPAREWQECQAKTRILTTSLTPFDLFETLRWSPESGCYLLERHLARMGASAEYFGWRIDLHAVRARLDEAERGWRQQGRMQRVRLVVTKGGQIYLESRALDEEDMRWSPSLRIGLALEPVDSANRFLYHKTTQRQAYTSARAAQPGLDDVILYNERGEICETTLANVAIEIDGRRVTPPVHCGLLPGTLRAELLAQGALVERVVTVAQLRARGRVWLLNSVRGESPGYFLA